MAPAATPGRRTAGRALTRLVAVAAAGVAALLFAPAFTPAASAPSALSSAAAVDAAAGRASGVQRNAAASARAARKVKRAGKGKYRGQVSPKLRALLQSDEYRNIINMLAGLEEQGLLDDFLAKTEAYWKDVNIFELAMEEQKGGGRKVVQTVKRDWPRIWPEQLDAERMPAFDKMAAFWRRIDQSRIVDQVMQEVLPNMGKQYGDMMADREQQRMMKMSDEERRDEIMGRLGNSQLVVQFAKLCEGDAEVSKIAPKMAPFIAKFVSILEVKVASQTESLGQTVDYAVFAVFGAALVAIVLATGIVKLPSDDAPPPPAYEAPAATATATS